MDCAEEVAALKKELLPLVGREEKLTFDLLQGKLTVEPPAGLSQEAIVSAVARAGLQARVWEDRARGQERFWQRRGRLLLCLSSGFFLLLGFFLHALRQGIGPALAGGKAPAHPFPLLARAAYLAAIACGAAFVLPRAFSALRRLRLDMHLLMTAAALGAVALGQYLEAASVTFLFSLALLLESWSVGRARRAVEALLDLAPPTARCRTATGAWQEIAVAEVAVGAIIQVRAGERIPLDGVIVKGQTAVDQAPITGEAAAVEKQPGDAVFAGTINQDGVVELRVEKGAKDTTLAHILRLIERARAHRARSERWVDTFAAYYTPAMMAAAAAVILLPPLLGGAPFAPWIYRGLVLLVIACPCALVIATPVSIVAGLTAAARQGVLIKGGHYLEQPARLRAIALDKTGTVTRGRLRLKSLIPLDHHREEELLARAAALEAASEHPLAQAILEAAHQRGIPFQAAEQHQSLPGRGATALLGGRRFWIGSHRLIHERGQESEAFHRQAAELEKRGETILAVGNEHHICGLLSLADEVRPEAAAAVQALRSLGIAQVTLLTGDHRGTAEAVARAVGIDDFRAELLPQDKVRQVQCLQDGCGPTAMVGDGINDAPALAVSNLGIAMGAAGSDAALEAADIALMSDDLTRLPWLIRHSRRTLRTIRGNAAFALGLKFAVLALAIAGQATLWMAIAADMGASLAVIANSLRLLHDKE